jgi:hypothetical protein
MQYSQRQLLRKLARNTKFGIMTMIALQFIERVLKGGREDTIISAGGVSLPGILDSYSDWEMASGC